MLHSYDINQGNAAAKTKQVCKVIWPYRHLVTSCGYQWIRPILTHMSQLPNDISIVSAVFCTVHHCDQHTYTDHATCGICRNRSHLLYVGNRLAQSQLNFISVVSSMKHITLAILPFFHEGFRYTRCNCRTTQKNLQCPSLLPRYNIA